LACAIFRNVPPTPRSVEVSINVAEVELELDLRVLGISLDLCEQGTQVLVRVC
jgi:hypothetical protein